MTDQANSPSALKREALENFRLQLKTFMEAHNWAHHDIVDVRGTNYDAQDFYRAALKEVAALQAAEREASSPEESDQAYALQALRREFLSLITEEADEVLADIKQGEDLITMKVQQAEQVSQHLKTLLGFEFLRTSLTGREVLEAYIRTLSADADRLEEIKATLGRHAQKLRALQEGHRAPRRRSSEEEARYLATERAELHRIFDSAESALRNVAKTSADLAQASTKVTAKIEEQALYNFLLTEREADERAKVLESADKAAGLFLSVGKHFVPEGFGWVSGLIDTLQTVTVRVAGEVIVSRMASEREGTALTSEVFDELSKDPAAMAKGLAITFKANLDLLLAAISIGTSDVPGWEIIKSGIQVAIVGYIDAQVTEAEALLLTAPSDKVEGIAKQFLKSTSEHLKEEFTERFLDVETYYDILEGLELKDIEDFAPDKLLDYASALVDVIGPFIVERVLTAFPPTPAQLVTGSQLVSAVQGISLAFAKNDYLRPGTAQVSSQKKPALSSQTLAAIPGLKIVDSNANWTEETPTGTRFYVAVLCQGNRIWGYTTQDGQWTADKPDTSAFRDWSARHIRLDGYTQGDAVTGKQTKGTWYQPIKGKLYFLFVSEGGSYEWANNFSPTAKGPGRYSVGAQLTDQGRGRKPPIVGLDAAITPDAS